MPNTCPTNHTAIVAASKKNSAQQLVQTLPTLAPDQKKFLYRLAQKYDAKQFMPNVNHVRSFLMHEHSDPARIKSRQQVTRRVFAKLARMPLAELKEIEAGGFYAPEKRLATYAAAINNYGRRLRGEKSQD